MTQNSSLYFIDKPVLQTNLLTTQGSAKFQTDAEVHGRAHEQVPESISHAPLKTEPCCPLGAEVSIFLPALKPFLGVWHADKVFLFALRIFSGHQLWEDQNTILVVEMENKEGDFSCSGGTVFSYYKSSKEDNLSQEYGD